MTLYDQVLQLKKDAIKDLTPECYDRLILIAWRIAKMYDMSIGHDVQMYEDYIERWGGCQYRFWHLLTKCENVCGPECAEMTSNRDEGEEVTSNYVCV
jgi:hypothetical protein